MTVTLTIAMVRAVFNGLASTADVSDGQLTQYITDVQATVNLKCGTSIVYTACQPCELVAIRNLAAVYAYCQVTGLSASGMAFQIGDFIHVIDKLPSNVQFVLNEALGIINLLAAAASTASPFYMGTDTT
jgi:hypothetical protein